MSSLARMATGIDTSQIRDALACNEDLWHLDTRRQDSIDVQRETQTIPLREADRSRVPAHLATEDVHPSRLTAHAWRLPDAVLLVQALAAELGVELARAMLVRLPPGRSVGRHRDHGAYYAIRNRYHVVIASEPRGSIVGSVDREVEMRPGELWELPNKELHWARNLSPADRIHLIFDVLPSPRNRLPTDSAMHRPDGEAAKSSPDLR